MMNPVHPILAILILASWAAAAAPVFTADFERDLQGFAARGIARLATTGDECHGGKSSLAVTARGKNSYDCAVVDVTSILVRGKTYLFSAWVKTPAGSPGAEWGLSFILKSGAKANYPAIADSRMDVASGTWTRLSGEYTCNWDESVGTVMLQVQSDKAGIGIPFFIDDVEILEAPVWTVIRKGDVTARVNTAVTFQALEGFGGSIAWYGEYLLKHPRRDEIFQKIFGECGVDVVRIRNTYDMVNDASVDPYYTEILKGATAVLGHRPKVLVSSWHDGKFPPAESPFDREAVKGKGPLRKLPEGFAYGRYADYWARSLAAYRAMNIPIDWACFANELEDMGGFAPTETAEKPGYDKAHHAVMERLKGVSPIPVILAPETMTSSPADIKRFLDPLRPDSYHGVAHHLYVGGSRENPDSFLKNLRRLATNHPGKPLYQTEYMWTTGLTTSWLIHNSLIHEGVVMYLIWDLLWNASGPNTNYYLTYLEDPGKQAEWKLPAGYGLGEQFYGLAHYARFTDPGWRVVDADMAADAPDLRITAFTSPEQDRLTVVLINTQDQPALVKLDLGNYQVSSSSWYRSVFAPGGTERFAAKGPLAGDRKLDLPGKSVVTVAISGKAGAPPHASAVFPKGLTEARLAGPLTKTAIIHRGTPAIGSTNETGWSRATPQKADTLAMNQKGPTATWRMLWDESFLYIRVDVTDDKLSKSNPKPYEQDSVEFFVNESGKRPVEYGAGDGHYRVNYGGEASFGTGGVKDGRFKAVARTVPGGYQMEVAIPWQSGKAAAGMTRGFELQVNDDPGTGKRESITKWNDNALDVWKDLSTLGVLQLVE